MNLNEGSLGAARRERALKVLTKKFKRAGAEFPEDDAIEATKKFEKRGRTVGRTRLTPSERESEREDAGKATLASGEGESYIERLKAHLKRQGRPIPTSPSDYFSGYPGRKPSTDPILVRYAKQDAETRKETLARQKAERQQRKERPGRDVGSPEERVKYVTRSRLKSSYDALMGKGYKDKHDIGDDVAGATLAEAIIAFRATEQLAESSLSAGRTARKAKAVAKEILAKEPEVAGDPEHPLHRFLVRKARAASAEVERKGSRGGSEEKRAREREDAGAEKVHADWHGGPLSKHDEYSKRMAAHSWRQGKPVGGMWSGVPSHPGDEPWAGPYSSAARQPHLMARIRGVRATKKEQPGAADSDDPKVRAIVTKRRLLGKRKSRG